MSEAKVPKCYAICPDAQSCCRPAVHFCTMCHFAYCSTHVGNHLMWREGYIDGCGLDSPAGKRYTEEPTPEAPPSP